MCPGGALLNYIISIIGRDGYFFYCLSSLQGHLLFCVKTSLLRVLPKVLTLQA